MLKELEEKTVSPLANDPQIFSKYTENLGLDLNTSNFYLILGFDEEFHSFTPSPVYAVIFLYPMGEKDGFLQTRYNNPLPDEQIPTPRPWFSLQTVNNACGTMAALHAIMNNLDHVKLKPDSWLSNFAKETANMTPEQRAVLIHNDKTLFSFHEHAAEQSNLSIPEKVTEHYITFIEVGGRLWELDGRKPQPICHGEVKNLLSDSLSIIKNEFMPHIKDSLNISLMSLSKTLKE